MEGKGRSEDNTEDFMEDGGQLRIILVRMEDIDLIQKSLLLGPYEVSLLLLNSIGIFDSVMYSPHPTVYLILHMYLRLNQLLLSFLARFLPAARRHLGYTSWSWTFFKYLLYLVHSFLVQ